MSSVHLEWKTTHVTLIHDADLEIDAFRAIFKNCLTQTNSWLKKNKDDFPIEIFKFFIHDKVIFWSVRIWLNKVIIEFIRFLMNDLLVFENYWKRLLFWNFFMFVFGS